MQFKARWAVESEFKTIQILSTVPERSCSRIPTAAASPPLLRRERLSSLDMEQIPGEAGMQPHQELKPEVGHQEGLIMEGKWQLAVGVKPL